MFSELRRDFVFLLLQFLDEEKYTESLHKFEKETGLYFNMKYFQEKVQAGEWEEVEKYLSCYTKVDDNKYSTKIFFEIRKHKYLEALEQNKTKAVEILVGDLKVFSTISEELYKDIIQLLFLPNFRENEKLSKMGDTETARTTLIILLKELIEKNPLLRDKLIFPMVKPSRLRELIDQSLRWQHNFCKNGSPTPDIRTLFTDHQCTPPNGPLGPAPVNLLVASAVAKEAACTPPGIHRPLPPPAAAAATANPPPATAAATGSPPPPAAAATANPPRAAGAATANPPRAAGAATANPPRGAAEATVNPPIAAAEAIANPHRAAAVAIANPPIVAAEAIANPRRAAAVAIANRAAAAATTNQPRAVAVATANPGALAGWMANASASSSFQAAVASTSTLPVAQSTVSSVKRTRPPPPGYHSFEDGQRWKRLRTASSVEQAFLPTARQQASWHPEDLPISVALTFNQGSAVMSMDFHPFSSNWLLVGSADGDITLWELFLEARMSAEQFTIWNIAACSLPCQASVKDTTVSVSRVKWSSDGKFIGVAFSKHLVHIYACIGPTALEQHLEIDAHVGSVNDLAFAYPNKQSCFVTCGDDKLIKVWDLTGRKLFKFEGHEAPVYSISPHDEMDVKYVYSTDIDGRIKVWLYDNLGSRLDYDAPVHGCTTMLYSADDSRLFSCGTSKEGESYLVEWDESQGAIRRHYIGFRNNSPGGVVQVDITRNRFLAAGEDGQIKFWDMDDSNMFTSADADGGLPSLPLLKFSKEGNFLAVTTADNGFKILANRAGQSALKADIHLVEFTPSVAAPSHVNLKVVRRYRAKPSRLPNGVDPTGRSMKEPIILEEAADRTRPSQLAEIMDSGECRVVTLSDNTDTFTLSKVVRLIYTNSGQKILALGSNGVLKLWKWQRNDQNSSGMATASAVPQHWRPNSGLLMTNDVAGVDLEEAVPCIALSKNDCYAVSASGGKASLFNLLNFKVLMTFTSPPPPPTSIAFHPEDNNIMAIGMEDSTINIYDVKLDKVNSKLKGHQKRITGLAFSPSLGILVSSGADAQLCAWSIDTWEKRKPGPVQILTGEVITGDTQVQFHSDQVHLLVINEDQLAIYDASKMERVKQWVPQDVLPAPISSAAYSCDSQLIFATFYDGNVGVFDADSLRPECRIAFTAYLSEAVLNGSELVYPLVVAAHPVKRNKLAVGLSDGSVVVMEPRESDGKWGTSPSSENGTLNGRASSSSATSTYTSDQLQR